MPQKTELDALVATLQKHPAGKRIIVAIAGAPGSGKSTIARKLIKRLNTPTLARAGLLEMDGYHYDNRVLRQLGRLHHKGAPDTFDVNGLIHTLDRLQKNCVGTVAVPVFDRSIETARAGARLIPSSQDIIIVEGNYLLLDYPGWNRLAAFFDITVMIRTPPRILRARLIQRWHNLGYSNEETQRKVEENDLPNGQTVINHSTPADFTL